MITLLPPPTANCGVGVLRATVQKMRQEGAYQKVRELGGKCRNILLTS